MHEPPPQAAQHPSAELANIVGLDHLGQVWIRSLDSLQREVAWIATSLDSAMLEQAIADRDLALIQRVAPKQTPVICALVRPHIALTSAAERPVTDASGTLHVQALSLGDGKATLRVQDKTLHIEAESIVSFARARLRIVGGTVDIG